MTKWIYLILPMVSAAVFAAVLLLKPHPAPMIIGLVDSDRVFERQPGLITLEKVESASRRAGARIYDMPVLGDSGFQDIVLRSESDEVRRELEINGERLISLWTKSFSTSLKQDYLILYGSRAESDKQKFSDIEKQLKAVYDSVMSPKAQAEDPLGAEKFRLMNLRLILRVLTRDPFVFPDSRLNDIQAEIRTIQETINTENALEEANLREAFKRESGAVREKFLRDSEENDKELAAEARRRLADAESLMKTLIADHRKKMDKNIQQSRLARETAFKFGGAAADPNSYKIDPRIFEEIKTGLRVEFDRRLRRKSFAVADRNHLAMIVDSPYAAFRREGRPAVDVSGEF